MLRLVLLAQRHVGIVDLVEIACRCLVELFVLPVLCLKQLPAHILGLPLRVDWLARGYRTLGHVAGLLRLLLRLKEVALSHLLLYLLLREHLATVLHLHVLHVLHVLIWCIILIVVPVLLPRVVGKAPITSNVII